MPDSNAYRQFRWYINSIHDDSQRAATISLTTDEVYVQGLDGLITLSAGHVSINVAEAILNVERNGIDAILRIDVSSRQKSFAGRSVTKLPLGAGGVAHCDVGEGDGEWGSTVAGIGGEGGQEFFVRFIARAVGHGACGRRGRPG